MSYPIINPVFLKLGPFEMRWYGLAYILGLLLGTWVIKSTLKKLSFSQNDIWDFMTYLMLGVLLGGRLGYILFYDLAFYLQKPLEIFALWHGGMSYHGGALGCMGAVIWFCKKNQKPIFSVLDQLALASTVGLFLGRLANFVNGELYGRVSDVSWAVVFPNGGPLPRHPSQLYEAFFEGILLFIILKCLSKKELKSGQLFSLYLVLYGFFRFAIEFFREPDSQLGFFAQFFTMGQLLCLSMILGGCILFYRRRNFHDTSSGHS